MNQNQPSTAYRYERKFVIPTKNYPLSLLLKTLKVPFREAYPERVINNVYFDTADFQSFSENVHGKADRVKVRMRWYDELMQAREYHPKLEFKIKHALLGTKKVYTLSPVTQRYALLNKQDIYSNLTSAELPADVLADLKSRQPVLINRYRRKYFESFNGHVRITLDTEISFRRFGRFNTKAGFSYGMPDVLELKYDADHEAHGQQIGSVLPFRMTKFSKYQLGMERTFFHHAH